MSELNINAVKDFVVSFMNEMCAWEIEANKEYSESISSGIGWDQAVDRARNKLEKIYGRYLTKKQRKTGRLAGPDVAAFPEYDPKLENIESIEKSGRSILVSTKRRDPNLADYFTLHRYKLVVDGDSYLIDTKESYSAYKKKWENQVL